MFARSYKKFLVAAVLPAVILFVSSPLLAADLIDDILAYRGGGDSSIPEYRFHDDGGFEAEGTAQDITSAINFVKVAAKPGYTSAEKLMCTKDGANDINCQVWNGSAWGNLLEVSMDAGADKAYDMAYEQASGEAMVCYRSPVVNSQTPRCRLWNGASWGTEMSALAVGGAINTMRLVADSGSDYIAMITRDAGADINVQIWNGTNWANLQEVSTNSGDCASCLSYDASWEKSGDDLVVAWFDDAANAIFSREFDKSSFWAPQITNVITGLSASDNVYVETDNSPDPTSSVILASAIDDDNTLNANSWNGAGWGAAGELSSNINGSVAANTHLFDLAFEQRPDYDAVLTYGSTANLLKYRVWDSSALAWGPELALPAAAEGKDWHQLASDPYRQNIMLTTVGTVNDVNTIEWKGSGWDAVWADHDTASNDVNWNAWYAYDYEDEDHTWPVVSFNGAQQKNDGTGFADISIEVQDDGLHPNKLKIEYETDGEGACNGPWAKATLAGPATADTNDGGGPPDVNNANAYQVGSGTNTRIVTYAGANTVAFDWNSKADLPVGNATYCLRATANDDEVDSAVPATMTLVIDNVAPAGLSALVSMGSSATVQHLEWSAVTETNFDHYEIWYGTSQADVQNRAGTALLWDELDYLAMGTITAHHTHISGLTPSTSYFYKIWAVDDFGNEQTVADLNFSTDPAGNNPPEAEIPDTISQAVDGSGHVTFSTAIYDLDIEEVEMRVRFSADNGMTFYNADIVSAQATPGDLVPADAFSIDNDDDFQIGHTDHILINPASRHPVRLTVVWDSKSANNQNGGLDGQAANVIIRVTPRDVQGEIASDYDSLPFALDNSGPTLAMITPVPAATSDTTPDLLFSSTTSGDIIYGGSCASSDTTASAGTNAITFDAAPAAEGTYANCTIMVTDAFANNSNILAVPSFVIDTTAPAGLGTLSAGANTQNTQTLSWSAVTETNFDHYEIWYGTIQADVQNRNGSAAEWDGANAPAMLARTTVQTTITGLSANTSYFYKIWAVDIVGHEATAADINAVTDANAKPVGTISGIIQAADGTKHVEVEISVSDGDGDTLRAKIEYETDIGGGCDGPWGAAALSGPVAAHNEDGGGPPDLNNALPYQLGSGAGTRIPTVLGDNTVRFQWDAANDLPTANNQMVCLRLIANDFNDDQASADTRSSAIDMVTPTVSAGNISTSFTHDAGTAGVAEIDDVIIVKWDNSAAGDNNSDIASVTANLESFGGAASYPMHDDASHGDVEANDNIYTGIFAIPASVAGLPNAHVHISVSDGFGNQAIESDDAFIRVEPQAPSVGGGTGYLPAPLREPVAGMEQLPASGAFGATCAIGEGGTISDRAATVHLSAGPRVKFMEISIDPAFGSAGAAVPYSQKYLVDVCGGQKECADGTRFVYARLYENYPGTPEIIGCAVNFSAAKAPAPAQSSAGPAFKFAIPLFLGKVHSDVIRLQQFLNGDPRTRLAAHGTGSPGRETDYFGSLTLAAVRKFQQIFNLAKPGDPGYGFVGPATRAKLNSF